MSIAAATVRMRPARGPALGKAPMPVTATVVSALLHVALAVALVVAARTWSASQPRIYVVNLVPAVAAVGSPQGRPALPPRPEELAPPPRTRPTELPQREVARDTAPPEMPARPREPVALPERDRALPPRPSAAPRAGERELPSLASPTPRPAPERAPSEMVARTTPPPPPPPIGRRDGSPQGAGPMTLNVSDFPFAWYLSRVQAKVTERWAGKAIPGQQPVAVFEIHRDGRVSGLTIEKPSGNPYYDNAALRAITEAAPFPPLPAEFPGQVLRVHLGFNFNAERG
ncbi:MAG TPA: TonB family protein [Methylomirabilota bacterium]|nr:TonB family protein [Methylomirabilota bacterium]